ncbi:MAG: SMP-30/gluconolactonase/LRE family protein [Pseudomonadota bacterium]
MKLYDERLCALGEGPLWHPERGQLFWFDIHGHCMLGRDGDEEQRWDFDKPVSAAGWINRDTLLVASSSGLLRLDLVSGCADPVASLESDRPETRSNDGRADPYGGFWIGTMGRKAEPGIGAIHRYYRGEVRTLFRGITISNAIAFHPEGDMASFADTRTRVIQRVRLGADGWPVGDPTPWIDLRAVGENPDGAVFDAEGHLWVALWGSGCVVRFSDEGTRIEELKLPVPQPSCPTFGGDGVQTLFVTSAREDMEDSALAAAPQSGAVFSAPTDVPGLPEHKVLL